MANVGDVLEFTLVQKYGVLADQMLNVFHYEITAASGPEPLLAVGDDLATQWVTQFAPLWAAVTSTGVSITGWVIQNLDDPDDFASGSFPTPLTGDVAGDSMPPFVAWGFKLNRTTRATRNGSKRFTGVPESLVASYIPTSGALPDLNDLAAFLGSEVDIAVPSPGTYTTTWGPRVIHKTGQFTYAGVNIVLSAEFRAVTTQSTRKLGRGA